jgi:uncharacterized membrane protein
MHIVLKVTLYIDFMLMVAISVLLFQLGLHWIDDGYGLHPAIAFPIASLLPIFTYIGFTKLYAYLTAVDHQPVSLDYQLLSVG